MCIGSMCNGDPLPTTYRVVGTPQSSSQSVFPAPLVMNFDRSPAAAGCNVTFTINGQTLGGKLHNCPSCLCVQVNP